MAQKRKLQVFVSSTFTDLKEERQAAVEAILTAGHIPAGMELFAAGDQSQMVVIQRWIDESDVYLLLLGGRYGSLEPESGLSYTHLEYQYAIQKGKAMFSLVITEEHLDKKVDKVGKSVLELDNPGKLKEFNRLVKTKLVKFWSDDRDIKLAVMQTLSEFDRRTDLTGWVPSNEFTDSGAIAEEIARLAKENAHLRDQLSQLNKDSTTYNGLDITEVNNLLHRAPFYLTNVRENYVDEYKKCIDIIRVFGDTSNLLYFIAIWYFTNPDKYIIAKYDTYALSVMAQLLELNLVERVSFTLKVKEISTDRYKISMLGKRLVLKVKLRVSQDDVNLLKLYLQKLTEDFTDMNEFALFPQA